MRPLTEKQTREHVAILADVEKSSGRSRWHHLHGHGHHWKTVQSCIDRGELAEVRYGLYELTDAGRALLASAAEPGFQGLEP